MEHLFVHQLAKDSANSPMDYYRLMASASTKPRFDQAAFLSIASLADLAILPEGRAAKG